ncbi:hypothetical protein GTW69_36035 [Streptomyces sp. SID7760]|nr:hypothetical protein [Streptomyces sp. SID7760]
MCPAAYLERASAGSFLAWVTVFAFELSTKYGPPVQSLRPARFDPAVAPEPISLGVAVRLREIGEYAEGNMTTYGGHAPFAGYGLERGAWSPAFDVTPPSRPGVEPQDFDHRARQAVRRDAADDSHLRYRTTGSSPRGARRWSRQPWRAAGTHARPCTAAVHGGRRRTPTRARGDPGAGVPAARRTRPPRPAGFAAPVSSAQPLEEAARVL